MSIAPTCAYSSAGSLMAERNRAKTGKARQFISRDGLRGVDPQLTEVL